MYSIKKILALRIISTDNFTPEFVFVRISSTVNCYCLFESVVVVSFSSPRSASVYILFLRTITSFCRRARVYLSIMADREELDITKDELDRIGEALKHKEFRDLLVEYCDEINDPASRKKYEEEIVALEKERGIDVTFVNPTPGYVIKTSVGGDKLAFINICSSELAAKPTSKGAEQEGSRGRQWQLPHIMSPPRDDMSKKGLKCTVYDVIFHPDALQLASQFPQFRDMIHRVACNAVESNFNVTLDKTNLKFPKLTYKGCARPAVIRKKNSTVQSEHDPETDKLYNEFYKKLDEHYDNKKFNNKPAGQGSVTPVQDYVTPKFNIRHRSDIDIQDFTYDALSNDKFASIPKELIVEIFLPLLKCSKTVDLDVGSKSLKMVCETPSKYKLEITLPYAVLQDNGSARFETDNHKLIIILPVDRTDAPTVLELNTAVTPTNDYHREDSGVESDHSPLTEVSNDKTTVAKAPLIEELAHLFESECLVESKTNETKSKFLDTDVYYTLPNYTFDMTEGDLYFTLNVRNVDPLSIVKAFNESYTAVHIKFEAFSHTFFRTNYAFYLKFSDWMIDVDNVVIDRWDNNVVVEIPNDVSNEQLPTSYYVGTDEESLQKMIIESNKEEQESLSDPSKESDYGSDANNTQANTEQLNKTDSEDTRTTPNQDNPKTDAVPIGQCTQKMGRSLSASSVEFGSLGRSHSPSKSILKLRSPVSRSMSESSLDDDTWSSSFDQCGTNSESFIPEESEEGEEGSSSMKKTVRFNDVVSKQVFRCNSSILGRRKKNQRKSRNKKRAQERLVSESETSEAEDKKNLTAQQDELKTKADDCSKAESKSDENLDFKSDLIFDLDM